MQRLFAVLLAGSLPLLVACATSPAREPVYRYINVVGGQIRLGEPFARFDLVEPVDDSTHWLRAGTFGGGGTRAILAHTDGSGILRGLTFVYDGTEDLAAKIAEYTESLGEPLETSRAPNGQSVHTWQDTETRFELHFDPGDKPEFWSRLFDRTGAGRRTG